MNEILHLNYQPGPSGWILRLLSRLQKSTSATLRCRRSEWEAFGLAELSMAFATRLALRYRAAYLLASLLNKLRDEIKDSGKLDHLLDGGYAYNPEDQRIFYDICVAFDALYFETKSAYEVVGKFVLTFGKKILDRNFAEQELKQVLEDAGQNIDWIKQLKENRNLFIHKTAPWIALNTPLGVRSQHLTYLHIASMQATRRQNSSRQKSIAAERQSKKELNETLNVET